MPHPPALLSGKWQCLDRDAKDLQHGERWEMVERLGVPAIKNDHQKPISSEGPAADMQCRDDESNQAAEQLEKGAPEISRLWKRRTLWVRKHEVGS